MINASYTGDTLTLNNHTLTKAGTNTFYLCNTTVTAGTINIAQGAVSVYNTAASASSTDFSLASGATLALNGFNLPIGSLTGSGGTVSLGSNTLTLGSDNTSPPAFAGTIIGSGGALTQTGSGMLTLTGSSTYTGATTISGGTLQLGNGGTAGALSTSGTISIGRGATLAFNRSDNVAQGVIFSGSPIAGGGNLVQLGPGTLTLNAANPYSGTTTVSGGGLLLNSGSLNVAGAVSVAAGAAFGGNGSAGSVTVNSGGTIQGGYNGAGTLTLAGLNFTGSGSVNETPAAMPYVPLSITTSNGLVVNGGTGSVAVNLGGAPWPRETITSSSTPAASAAADRPRRSIWERTIPARGAPTRWLAATPDISTSRSSRTRPSGPAPTTAPGTRPRSTTGPCSTPEARRPSSPATR